MSRLTYRFFHMLVFFSFLIIFHCGIHRTIAIHKCLTIKNNINYVFSLSQDSSKYMNLKIDILKLILCYD